MMNKRNIRGAFNWSLLIVIVLVVGVLLGTAIVLRGHNRRQRAEKGLEAGLEKYEEGQWSEAASYLGLYLSRERDDVDILMKYAEAQMNIRPRSAGSIKQAINAYRNVRRVDPAHREATVELIKLYLAQTPDEAEYLAREFLKQQQDQEVRRLLASALAGQRKFEEAGNELNALIEEHPDDIAAYEMMARLDQISPEDILQSGDYWVEQAVQNNPEAADAYIARAGFLIRKLGQNNHPSEMESLRTEIVEQLLKARESDDITTDSMLRLAGAYLFMEMLPEAKEILDGIVVTDDTRLAVWRARADYARKSDSPVIMAETAAAGLKENVRHKWDFIPDAIELYILANEIDQAQTCIEEIEKKGFRPELSHYYRGMVALKGGDIYQSLADWKRSLELGNDSPRLKLSMAEAYEAVGDLQSSLQLLRRLIQAQPNNFKYLSRYAEGLMQAGRWEEAVEYSRLALLIKPGHKEMTLLYLRARLNELERKGIDPASGQWMAIEKRIDRLYEDNPEEQSIGLVKLQAEVLKGDREAARSVMDALKKKYPDSLSVQTAEVDMLNAAGASEKAMALLREIVERHPESASAVSMLINNLMQREEYEAAEKLVNDFLKQELTPIQGKRFARILLTIYDRKGDQVQSEQLIQDLQERYPRDLRVRTILLNDYLQRKEFAAAQGVVDEIKKLEGEDGWRWRYEQARLWWLSPQLDEKYNQAITLLQENTRSYPEETTSQILLALIHEKQGMDSLAAAAYQEAWQKEPRRLELVLATYDALMKVGKKDEAMKVLERAAENDLVHPALEHRKIASYLDRGEIDPGISSLELLVKDYPQNQQNRLLLAQLKMRRDMLDEAELLLKDLRAETPEDIDVLKNMIQLYLLKEQPEQALRLCNQYVADNQDASAFLMRAQVYRALRKPDSVMKDLQRAIDLSPDNLEVLLSLFDHYQAMGQREQASNVIRAALELDAGRLETLKRAIGLFLSSPDAAKVAEGRALLEKALALYPDDVDLNVNQARLLVISGSRLDLQEAEKILARMTGESPRAQQPWLMLGELALSQGNANKVMDIVLRGLMALPESRELLFLKAQAEAMHSHRLALLTLKNLYRLERDNIKYVMALADAYLHTMNWDEAISLLNENLDKFEGGNRLMVESQLVRAKYKKGEKQAAMEAFHRLIENSERKFIPLQAQIQLLIEQKDWAAFEEHIGRWPVGALYDPEFLTPLLQHLTEQVGASESGQAVVERLLKEALARHPDQTALMIIQANQYLRYEKVDAAIEAFVNVLEKEPENILVINNLAWMLTHYKQNHQEALALAQKGMKLNSNYLDLIDTLGTIYYNLEEYDKARGYFEKCVELYPRNVAALTAAHYHYGKTLYHLNRRNDALRHINEALELNETQPGLMPDEVDEAKKLREMIISG